MTGLSRLQSLCVVLPALLLTPIGASAGSHDCPEPKTSYFDQNAAQTLFENRGNPAYWIQNPICEHSAKHTVTDGSTEYPDHPFELGANPCDTEGRYAKYPADGSEFRPNEETSQQGYDALMILADALRRPLEPGYLPAETEEAMANVASGYGDRAPDAVKTLQLYFGASGWTEEEGNAELRRASEAVNVLLALSGVSVTCRTLASRPKYKHPWCPGVTAGFDLEGCQFNYDSADAIRKRGIVRVVWYTPGYRGQHAHAKFSRRFYCDDDNDRADLDSWFPRSAFRHICRREDEDIPYQTGNYTCE